MTQEPELVPSLRSDSRCRHREQVTKALTQVPTTSTAGSCQALSLGMPGWVISQAMLSCPTFFTRSLLQEKLLVPKHKE